jgi:hypothetical protein
MWEFQLTHRTLQLLDRPYYVGNKSVCTILLHVHVRCDNSVWWPGYRQENQGIVVQFSGEQKFVFSPKHPAWLCKQPSLLSSADQGLFLPWVKRLGNVVLKLRMSGALPPLPYVFMVCRDTTLTLFPETYELYV